MPSTKSQKVVKAADSEDETRTFYRKQKNMQKASNSKFNDCETRVHHKSHATSMAASTFAMAITNAHTPITVSHTSRHAPALPAFQIAHCGSDINAKIPFRSRPGTNTDVPSFDHTAFEALRDLLANKADIERRIAKSIETLEKAMNTASREFQVVLSSQAEAFRTATVPATTSAAAASSKALIVKH
ncbi:hypothetical protein KCU91_g11432, partial [Aureobasidium melanogenum]